MIYDQALVIELPSKKLTANFKYTVNTTPHNYDRLSTGDYDKFISHCDSTMVGFQMKDNKFSCLIGSQTQPLDSELAIDETRNAAFYQNI